MFYKIIFEFTRFNDIKTLPLLLQSYSLVFSIHAFVCQWAAPSLQASGLSLLRVTFLKRQSAITKGHSENKTNLAFPSQCEATAFASFSNGYNRHHSLECGRCFPGELILLRASHPLLWGRVVRAHAHFRAERYRTDAILLAEPVERLRVFALQLVGRVGFLVTVGAFERHMTGLQVLLVNDVRVLTALVFTNRFGDRIGMLLNRLDLEILFHIVSLVSCALHIVKRRLVHNLLDFVCLNLLFLVLHDG